MPGQLGPISLQFDLSIIDLTRIISATGMPSVIATINSIPASTASIMASPAKGGGTKMAETVAPVSLIASSTVLNIGTHDSNVCPPFPGVTPATTFVP